MAQKNRKELHELSNQMIQLFIKDVFSKNNTDMEKAKKNITDEQRESLKKSLNHLETQVESFLNDKNASKTTTENDQESNDESLSPLREKLMKQTKAEEGTADEDINEEKKE